jgi:hypothetical protein
MLKISCSPHFNFWVRRCCSLNRIVGKNEKFINFVLPGVVIVCLKSAFKLDWQVRRGCFNPYACDGAKMSQFVIACRNHFESIVAQVRMPMEVGLYKNGKRFKIYC